MTEKRKGAYLGTEISGSWWRRYTANGFLMRGRGQYWFDQDAFYFLRSLTSSPIKIELSKVREVRIGSWHAGKWIFGHPIVKVTWHNGQFDLSSGFVVEGKQAGACEFKKELETRIKLL